MLMKTDRDGFSLSLPRNGKHRSGRAVRLTEHALRVQVMHTARQAYRALGGAHWEWEPADLPAAA